MKIKKEHYVIIVIAIFCIGAYAYYATSSFPPSGWHLDTSLTQQFYDEEIEDGFVGAEYAVYTDDTVEPPAIPATINVRLYKRVVYPGAQWTLEREGTYDNINNEFNWN